MKELAVVKLTKTLLGKVGKKFEDKKQKWKQEAALSVEETKRREAEFKEDFAKVTKKFNPEMVKEEIPKEMEEKRKVEVSESEKNVENKESKEPEIKQELVKENSTKQASKQKKTVATKKNTAPAAKAPSKKEAKLALYSEDIKKHYGEVDKEFLEIVVKNLGPSIYKKDAELVSCSDSKELDTVRKNFLVKKLQMQESDDVLNSAIKEVCSELKDARKKYRATFYYALVKKFKLESKLS